MPPHDRLTQQGIALFLSWFWKATLLPNSRITETRVPRYHVLHIRCDQWKNLSIKATPTSMSPGFSAVDYYRLLVSPGVAEYLANPIKR